MYKVGRSYGSTYKEAFKKDELAYELQDEDREQGTYNPYVNSRPEAPDEGNYDTFDGWKARGRFLKRGQKAQFRQNGVPVFGIEQTYEKRKK